MKFSDFISEVFEPQSAFDIRWYSDGFSDRADAEAEARDRSLGIISIRFHQISDQLTGISFSRNRSYDVTNQGDAVRVLATVLESIRQYLSRYPSPAYFLFAAEGNSRIKLYNRMVKRYAASLGYDTLDPAQITDAEQAVMFATGETTDPDEIDHYRFQMSDPGLYVLRRRRTAASTKGNSMRFKDFSNQSSDNSATESRKDPCWAGYQQVGLKKKKGRKVPNCVPTEEQLQVGDGFVLGLEDLDIVTQVVGITEDGVVIHLDQAALDQVTNVMVTEAEYQGRTVTLNRPMKGDVKKSKVYVKGPTGRVVKVNFGDKNMTIKKHIPGRRKSFRARHNCDNPGPKYKARYWSCRAW